MGVEFHASYRPGGFIYPANYGPTLPGVSFYEQHPELVCMNREGKPMPRISYAFPETRRYVLSLFREVATENPVDGVAVLYNRRPPLVAYEAPVVEGFQKEYGLDPRQLPENDPRFMRHRSQFLTQFMRELRAELDQIARELKRETPFEITAVVSNGEENLLLGMDLATWVEEGLVDLIIPYSSVERIGAYGNKVGPNTWDGEPSWEDPEDVEWFVSLVKGTRTRVALNMMPRFLTKEAQYRKAHQLYEAGVEILFFWDGTHRVRNVLRLGHREEVSDWMASGQPPFRPTAVRVWGAGGMGSAHGNPRVGTGSALAQTGNVFVSWSLGGFLFPLVSFFVALHGSLSRLFQPLGVPWRIHLFVPLTDPLAPLMEIFSLPDHWRIPLSLLQPLSGPSSSFVALGG